MAWVLIVCSAFTFSLSFFNLYQAISHPLKYEKEIIEISSTYDLSPSLVASVIEAESSFNKDAKSNKNAIGLMQIKLTTANYMCDLNKENHISEQELFLPSTNIKYGCMYLKYLMSKFENLEVVLACYNAGETTVRSWLNSGIYSTDKKTLMYIPYEETRNYVKKINKNIKYYEKNHKKLIKDKKTTNFNIFCCFLIVFIFFLYFLVE